MWVILFYLFKVSLAERGLDLKSQFVFAEHDRETEGEVRRGEEAERGGGRESRSQSCRTGQPHEAKDGCGTAKQVCTFVNS